MSTTAIRMAAMTLAIDDPLVERAAPGLAPTAFRIWAAGENKSDDGSVFFTQASADALMAEQEARGRVYSADFDHLSLLPNRPAEAGRASAWHKIETRPNEAGDPELWAVDIQWCEDAKAGLEEDPPRWRFFSPAFRHDDDGEVTSYVNFALCINPLTHGLPSLASETPEKHAMTKEEAAEAVKKLGDIGAGEDERKSAATALAEFLEGLPDAPAEEKKPEPGAGEDAGEAAAKAADAKPEPDKEDKGEEKTETKAALAMASALAASDKRIARLEIDALLRERADLPEATRTWCATQSVETVKSFLKSTPKMAAARSDKTVQGEDAGKPAGLHGAELEELNRGMGVRSDITKQFERRPSGELVTHNIGPTRARELHAQAARAGAK